MPWSHARRRTIGGPNRCPIGLASFQTHEAEAMQCSEQPNEVTFCTLCGAGSPDTEACPARPPLAHAFLARPASLYICSGCRQKPGKGTWWCPVGRLHKWHGVSEG